MRTPRVLKKDGWTPLTISGKISNNVSGRELLGGPVSTITSSSASGEQGCAVRARNVHFTRVFDNTFVLPELGPEKGRFREGL